MTPTAELPLGDSALLKIAVTPLARTKPSETVELKLSVLPVNVAFALIVNVLTVCTLLKVIAELAVSNTTSLDAVGRVSALQLAAVVHSPEAPPPQVCAHAHAPANYALIPIRVQVELKDIA